MRTVISVIVLAVMSSILLVSGAVAKPATDLKKVSYALGADMAMNFNTSVSRCSGCASAVVTPQRRSL